MTIVWRRNVSSISVLSIHFRSVDAIMIVFVFMDNNATHYVRSSPHHHIHQQWVEVERKSKQNDYRNLLSPIDQDSGADVATVTLMDSTL